MSGLHQYFKILKAGSTVLIIVALTTSILAGQMYAPVNFGSMGRQKTTLTSFLRATVKLGDSYLIKQVFHESLVAQYPVVFNSYLQENDWFGRLKSIEERAPQSRDLLNAIAMLLDRMGNQSAAKTYRERVAALDPMSQL